MTPTIIIMVGIGLLVFALLIAAIVVQRKKKTPPDYYTFFIMGIIWIPVGIATDNSVFTIMGFVFMAVGLANKDKWKKHHPSWKQLGKEERRLKIIIIGLLGLVVLAGVVAFLLVQKGLL